MFTKSALALTIVLATTAGALAATKKPSAARAQATAPQSRVDQRNQTVDPYAWQKMDYQLFRVVMRLNSRRRVPAAPPPALVNN